LDTSAGVLVIELIPFYYDKKKDALKEHLAINRRKRL